MRRVLIGIGLAAVLAFPSVARAQEQKIIFRPMVGGVVGAGPGAAFGAAISFKASGKLQIHGEFGRLLNILPKKVADQVEVNAAVAANAFNGKHSAEATAAASYGMVGFRQALRDVSGANTFVEIGVGMAHVTSDLNAEIRGSSLFTGDFSTKVTTPFTSGTPENKPMVSVGGGLVLGINRKMAVELGARYIRIFTDATAINAANIFGGFRVGF